MMHANATAKVVVKDRVIGKHVYGVLYDASAAKLGDKDYILDVVRKAAEKGNAVIYEASAWKTSTGVIAIALIVESHIIIHTLPSHRIASVDVYTCGEYTDAEASFAYIVSALEAKRVEKKTADRSMNVFELL